MGFGEGCVYQNVPSLTPNMRGWRGTDLLEEEKSHEQRDSR